MIREDLSDRLVHLTRGRTYAEASAILAKILAERRLLGGKGMILGGYCCICFSEAPIAKLGYILAQPMAHGVRYKPYGVMLSKQYLYERGGRPVIYQAKSEFEQLPESQRFRHVTYAPPNTDFTWEREWRLKEDYLDLDPTSVTVIVPNRTWIDRVKDEHIAMLGRRALLTGMVGPKEVVGVPWHFLALEDLGVPIPAQDEVATEFQSNEA